MPFKLLTLLLFTSFPNPGLADDSPSLPKALLIGDSISLGYTKDVIDLLEGEAEIFRPLNGGGGYLNCQGTTFGLKHLDSWLAQGKWDVIHFNFGLHDLKHVDPTTGRNSKDPAHPQQADLATYEANLRKIVQKLKATKAHLIFATTTPFPDRPGGPLRRSHHVEKYNAAAREIMAEHAIAINDLHAFVLPRMNQLLMPNNVHFTPQGSRELAKQVARQLRGALSKASPSNSDQKP